MKRLIPLILLLVTSCGPIWGEEEEKVDAVDRWTVSKVVDELLTSISRKHEEMGPLFISHLPKLKNDAAKREGFADWAEFKLAMNATSPEVELEVARRITAHLNSLLTPPEEE